jgi:hypothetical protein
VDHEAHDDEKQLRENLVCHFAIMLKEHIELSRRTSEDHNRQTQFASTPGLQDLSTHRDMLGSDARSHSSISELTSILQQLKPCHSYTVVSEISSTRLDSKLHTSRPQIY